MGRRPRLVGDTGLIPSIGVGRGTYLDVGVTLLWRWVRALVFDTDVKNTRKTPMARFERQFVEARHPDRAGRALIRRGRDRSHQCDPGTR